MWGQPGVWGWNRGSEIVALSQRHQRGPQNAKGRGLHLPDFTLLRSRGDLCSSGKRGGKRAASAQRRQSSGRVPAARKWKPRRCMLDSNTTLKPPVTRFSWPKLLSILFFCSSFPVWNCTNTITYSEESDRKGKWKPAVFYILPVRVVVSVWFNTRFLLAGYS